MEYRTLRLSDLEQLPRLAHQLGYEATLEEIQKRYVEMQDADVYGHYVAVDKQRLIGWIQVNVERTTLLAEGRAEVTGVVVDEDYRGKGIGRELLELALEWARERELSLMRLRTNAKRLEAHRFYEREGFKFEKSWHLFTKRL